VLTGEVADVFVGDLDDVAMIRVYARENATQRGNSSSAVAGSVASAVRFLSSFCLRRTSVQLSRGYIQPTRQLLFAPSQGSANLRKLHRQQCFREEALAVRMVFSQWRK
jgi:hypothetical protein